MKTAVAFFCGTFFGVILVYAWHGYRYSNVVLSDGSPGEVYSVYAVEDQSFYIPYAEELIAEDVFSGQKYEVSFTPREEGVVDYISKSLDTGEEVGKGSLFENYEVTDVDIVEFATEVEDMGSSTRIDIGSNQLVWSRSSKTAGWVLYNPYQLALSVQRSNR